MTREEIIKSMSLQDAIQVFKDTNCYGTMDIAKSVILKVLEQESTIRNCFGCKYSKDDHNSGTEVCHLCMWENQYTPTTKNDSPHCQHTDEEIAKSFIEDVEAVKDQLPCGEQMDFPSTFDEFAKDYGFKDKDEVYTNGSELIPVFRVKQWLEHISTTKNNLEVDTISRDAVLKPYEGLKDEDTISVWLIRKNIEQQPSVKQEPRKGHWIKGYTFPDGAYWKCDKCNELIKVKFPMNYCNNCGADMREVEE